jgi:subtilisin family serine protease
LLVNHYRTSLLIAAVFAIGSHLHADKQTNPPNWGIDRIDQPHGTNGVFRWAADGTGVHIYIIDSGVRTTHQEFGGRAVFEKNFCPDAIHSAGADDDHGTHNASIAAGATVGIARNAAIHSLRAFGPGCDNHSLAERASYMTSALQWVIDHGQKPGVVNFSAGSLNSDPVRQKVLDVAHAGFPIAVSAGCTADSAAVWGVAAANQKDGVFIAGSIDRNDNASPNIGDYGPALTMFAPAVHLVAAMNSSDSAYGEIAPGDPTCADSFAAPHIAGVLATYLQSVRTLETPAQIYAAIINGAPGRSRLWVSGVASNRHTAPDRILQSLPADRLYRNSVLSHAGVTHSVWSSAQDGSRSNPGQYQLVYSDTGNLVLRNASGAVVWSAETSSRAPGFARMQDDGNLVLGDAKGAIYWQTSTAGHPGAFLTVGDDGHARVLAADGITVLWASGTHPGRPAR